MLLRQIRYFVSVVECGSFTEAAARCYISQSAMSQQIQALEYQVGVPLLTRGNRRFTVTAAGDYFYRHGRALLEEAERLKRETARIGKRRQTLTIGYLSVYCGPELSAAVGEISARHPDLDVNVVNATHEELYQKLRAGEVDIVLSDPRRAFSDDFINRPIFTGTCHLLCRAGSSSAGEPTLSVENLGQEPLILIASKPQRKNEQSHYRETLGISGPLRFAEHMDEARLLVASGKGLLPVLTQSNDEPDPRFRRIPLSRHHQPVRLSYYLFWVKNRNSPLLEEFARILTSEFGNASAASASINQP